MISNRFSFTSYRSSWIRLAILMLIGSAKVLHASDSPIRFNRDIRPLLSETCFHCHGPDEHGRQAGLRLDTIEGATEDLGGYQPITPGDLENSEAWSRIVSDDPDMRMPPPDSHLTLSEDQQNRIRRWIEEGAKYEGHWAFSKPEPVAIPDGEVADADGGHADWGHNSIDAFIAAKLAELGQTPSGEADPRTLIRRLSFDLIGLPPTVQQVEAFVDDYGAGREVAYQDAITRLLDSRHFGERMAVPWMDQARYADTNGYSIDGGRDMWLWRDWVIEAYNNNLPFDDFLRDQLAGDLVPNATEAQRIASGFNRNHMITHEGGTIPEENLTNYAADRVKTTSEVFLGLTIGCAQCHDHKYDPISQKEYYQLFSFFNELGDNGLDGDGGRNAKPRIAVKTVLPKDEVAVLREELNAVRQEWASADEGFDQWLTAVRQQEAERGNGFEILRTEMLDVSSPNRPGDYTLQEDGSTFIANPLGGQNGFSHSIALPSQSTVKVSGIRIRFMPYAKPGAKDAKPRLTPFRLGVPLITTILVSADDQPAKQVDIYQQLRFDRATASSSIDGFDPSGVLDERNLDWWRAADATSEQHITLTFDEPVDPAEQPFLSVLIIFGKGQSLPHHWAVEAFTGQDTDSRFTEQLTRILARPEEQWSEEERGEVMDLFRDTSDTLAPLRTRMANLQERIDVLTQPHETMVMNTAEKPRETFVLSRGQYDAPLEKVEPTTPSVLPPLESSSRATRLDLANWLVDPEHPLTARVAVNRIWSLFFGTGIVASSADFGSQGEWPSHPELLDHLAIEFSRNGWDQKQLIREIVSSATYRQDASASPEQLKFDPQNRFLARGPRFRLQAEFIRDAALAISGLLVKRIGGPSVAPYQPPGLWKEVSHFGSTPATKQVYVQDHGEKLYRRSLYTVMKRTSPNPAMSAFDAPNREMCTVQRGVTNTPLQALVTLNDPQFSEASRVFAASLLQSETGCDDAERIEVAFEQVTLRAPTENETDVLLSLLEKERMRYHQSPESARQTVSVGEWPLATNLDIVEHAAWTQIAALLMNLSESLTRN